MSQTKRLIGLDIGTVRIGVAVGDTAVRIASPLQTVQVDGTEIQQLAEIAKQQGVDTFVVGYPRNQSGEATAQTEAVEAVAKQLESIATIVFQDESLTSVIAVQRLQAKGGTYSKNDVDAEAASILLQDYLEANYEQ